MKHDPSRLCPIFLPFALLFLSIPVEAEEELEGLADDLPPVAVRTVDFEADIRPILAESCLGCHGGGKRRGGLRLDRREDARTGGDSGPAFEPGDSASSLLIHKVAGTDPVSFMPPEGEELSPDQVGLLRAWIDQGADWSPTSPGEAEGRLASDHWSFRAPTRSELPEVQAADWPRTPIDRFILARLEQAEGLAPTPEADRPNLIRRLSLDLLGLPPTPEEVDAFVADPRPDAYEQLVDRLLESPHYGERRARRWLDLARYADTNGYEKDRERSIWPYRDWVIDAFNADMPFDRFTIEQIAGDMMPGTSASQRIATGFHRNTMINEEGGIDVEEFRFASVVDRVATTGSTWLGLTIGCAQCHTHKFDPITQREYYQFFAFLNNADEPEMAVPDPSITAHREQILALVEDQESRLDDEFPLPNESDLDTALTVDERRRRHLADSQASWEAGLRPHDWTVVAPARFRSENGATLTLLDDDSILVSGDKPNQDTYLVVLETDRANITGLRLEVLPHESLPDQGPGRAPLFSVGDFLLTEFEVETGPIEGSGDLEDVPLAHASEDYSEEGHLASLAIDGVHDTGWNVKGETGKAHAAVFEFAGPIGDGSGSRLVLTMRQEYIHQMTIGRFRVSVTSDPAPVRASGLPGDVEAIARISPDRRSPGQQDLIRDHYLSVAPELEEPRRRIEELRRSMPALPTTLVMRERLPEHARETTIHQRGEFLSPTEPVEPGVPAVLHPLPESAPRDRLALARWLVAEDNPLVGRVVVNRLWADVFGRGLVATVDDFGTRAEPPSHPELLDWLATEFLARGWSLKAMHRLMVTSATYRQDSAVTPELLERDPGNELLARGPRFRVEAEVVRDLALAASGLLNREIGGPSVYPPQPEGATALAYGKPDWPTSEGPDRTRRGLYTFAKRTAPYAAFTTFDAPTPEVTCPRRERSNTPLQALTLLNDDVFVEAAQALAGRVIREVPDGSAEDRAVRAFRLCLSRAPDPSEIEAILGFYRAQLERLRAGDLDPGTIAGTGPNQAGETSGGLAERAAWATVARALLNLDETITKE